ncbi:protein lingerer isoform X7 [Bradysia coprophila]|uniref:protein lingerer isoform X7 n=2 Tax=Bradysia coprophila TaxID=38358 RepID=UPI00187D9C71|nr:protein lingerer isoform X7 [Bradysia coprophila]
MLLVNTVYIAMSSQTRTTGGSRPSKKTNNVSGSAKTVTITKKTEHPKPEKDKVHVKPTAEQIRIAQITDINSGSEDPKMREKVASLMETTHRSEEDVCCALYECDNDLDRAVIFLFETLPVGAFETSSKKKKNRLTSGSGDATGDEWGDNGTSGPNNNDVRERSRNRTGMRGGRGGSDSRGWRGRESRENDRNASDNRGERVERWQGGSRGSGRGGFRGGFGSRGGRGGRGGSRGTNRDNNRIFRPEENHEVETWNNSLVTATVDQNKTEDWGGDWDNDEYTESLADSKVFTPSVNQNQTVELSAPPGLEQQLLNPPSQLTDDLVQYSATVVSSTATAGAVAAVNNNQVQYPEIHGSSVALRQALDLPQINASSLSVEQSQYFKSLSSQNSNQQASMNAYQVPQPVQYSTSYSSNNSYVDQVVSSQQAPTRKPRARVPPPSKIPSTAVEMPGDTLNNIGYLDVQFGQLEFGNEEAFDAITDKFNATIDSSQSVTGDVTTDYQTKSSVQQQQNVLASQMIPTADVLSGQSDGLSTAYNQRGGSVQQSVSVGSNISNSAALEQLAKADHYGNAVSSSATSGYHNQSAYNNNVSNSKTSGYQPGANQQGYTNSNYSQQVTTGNSYSTAASNSSYSSYNQSGVNPYQQSNSNNVSGVNSSSGVSSNNSVPVGSGSNNSNSNSNSGYLSSQYPSSQTSSTYPSQPSNAYQSSQSVYGNTGLSNNTGYANSSNVSSAASQYSNFSSTKLKETTPVTTIYESVVSSAPSVLANSAITTSSMSSPSLGLNNTKVTSSATKSSGIVPSNVAMVSQYIPTGMPFYQQPTVYSYEEIQMMQQRMPHVPGYYDMNYQPPTSLGAAGVRDGNIGSVAAYSTISDARFTRTDNNSSPVSNVPSTMSQQTGSGGPLLNLPYAYFYGGNMMAGGFQYGTPAIYPQQMPTANASSGGQFPKPSYNSGYGSTAYDTLGQNTQDYSKGAYPGTGVGQQSKGQNVTNPPPSGTGADISSSMYGKSHVALNKVNSYDKQSYSATPPPFNLTGTQTAGANSQGYNAQHMYIQAMPPAGHHMHQQIQDSNSTGQRQQSSSQSKSGAKPGYSPSYWTAQN